MKMNNIENIDLIQKCLEFYANEENYSGLIELDRGKMARETLEIIDLIFKENNQYINQSNDEKIIEDFLKNIDDFKSY